MFNKLILAILAMIDTLNYTFNTDRHWKGHLLPYAISESWLFAAVCSLSINTKVTPKADFGCCNLLVWRLRVQMAGKWSGSLTVSLIYQRSSLATWHCWFNALLYIYCQHWREALLHINNQYQWRRAKHKRYIWAEEIMWVYFSSLEILASVWQWRSIPK